MSEIKNYLVCLPLKGFITLETRATSEEEAIEKSIARVNCNLYTGLKCDPPRQGVPCDCEDKEQIECDIKQDYFHDELSAVREGHFMASATLDEEWYLILL